MPLANSPPDEPDRDGAPLTLAQLAHELNSLLDGSLRYVGLAIRSLDGADRAAEKLHRAHGAMMQMAALLDRVMRQRDATRGVLARRETIDQEVHWLAEMVEPMAAAEGVEISIQVDQPAAMLPVGSMGTVLLNGLRNAIQACARRPEGRRRIDVVVNVDGPSLVISITDSGRGPTTEAATPAGHGLGMALCSQIVEDLGGTLELLPGPDGGSRFVARVPVQPCPSGQGGPARQGLGGGPGRGMTVQSPAQSPAVRSPTARNAGAEEGVP